MSLGAAFNPRETCPSSQIKSMAASHYFTRWFNHLATTQFHFLTPLDSTLTAYCEQTQPCERNMVSRQSCSPVIWCNAAVHDPNKPPRHRLHATRRQSWGAACVLCVVFCAQPAAVPCHSLCGMRVHIGMHAMQMSAMQQGQHGIACMHDDARPVSPCS